jgi:hypothetical protein
LWIAFKPADVAAKDFLLSSPHSLMFEYNSVMIIAIFVTLPIWVTRRLSSVVKIALFDHLLSAQKSKLVWKMEFRIRTSLKMQAKLFSKASDINAITAVDLDLLVQAVWNPVGLGFLILCCLNLRMILVLFTICLRPLYLLIKCNSFQRKQEGYPISCGLWCWG